MGRFCGYLVTLCLALNSSTLLASANTFVTEVERLVAVSDETYTVIVNQYEQTYSYWTGINRLIVRVIDIETNQIASQVLLSSIQLDRSKEKPYEITASLKDDESQAFENLLIKPQLLYANLEYPKYRFHIDKSGVFINKNGRQDILDYKLVENRFSQAGFELKYPIDAEYDLALDIESNNVAFTGWYKATVKGKKRYFFVLKIGLHQDDTGSLEYVFSIPES